MWTRGSRKSRAWPIWARSSRACANRGSPDSGSALPTWTITACAATSPGASPAAPWKARSAPTAARKVAGLLQRNRVKNRRLERLVGAVAKRRVAGMLAAAQPEFFGLGYPEFHRRELAALMRAVAKRLAFRTPTAAPPIITGGELDCVRGFLRDMGFGHICLLWGAQTPESGWDRCGSITRSPSFSREVRIMTQ